MSRRYSNGFDPITRQTLRSLSRTNKNARNSIARSQGEIYSSFNTLSGFNNNIDVSQRLLFPNNMSGKNNNNVNELMKRLDNELRLEKMGGQKSWSDHKRELNKSRGYGPKSQENLKSRLKNLKSGIENIVIPSPPKTKVVVYKNNNKNSNNGMKELTNRLARIKSYEPSTPITNRTTNGKNTHKHKHQHKHHQKHHHSTVKNTTVKNTRNSNKVNNDIRKLEAFFGISS
jgi:hypothetical protein